MKKTIKVGTYHHKTITVEIETRIKTGKFRTVNLVPIEQYTEVAFTGEIGQGRQCESCGQIDKTLREMLGKNEIKLAIPEEKLHQILVLWKRWHMNGMNAGTREQSYAIDYRLSREQFVERENVVYSYDAAIRILENSRLLEDRGYRYGTDWLVEIVPEDVLAKIEKL